MGPFTILLAGLLFVPHGPSRPVTHPSEEVRRIMRVAEREARKEVLALRIEHEASIGAPLCDSACVECESGGDPSALSPSGTYWGLYQFDYQTWVGHGGHPRTYGRAPAAEQHEVAARVTYDAWPNC